MSNWTDADVQAHYDRLKGHEPQSTTQSSSDSRPEREIQEECAKFMEADGWRALRTDPVSDKSRGKGFGEIGMADYQFTRPAISETARKEGWCQLLYVEFKARGGKPKKHQTEWHCNERTRGFLTWIASVDFPASVEGFREHYAKSGLMRRVRWW